MKDLREVAWNRNHQEALRLWMAYAQTETRAQFVRLLGLGKSGPRLTRRWELRPGDAGAQRPGSVSLHRLFYLLQWQWEEQLLISDLDEVDWNRKFIVARDEYKPIKSPFLQEVGGSRGQVTSVTLPSNLFSIARHLINSRHYPYRLTEVDLARLLGLKPNKDMRLAYQWKDGRRTMSQAATIRMLIVLLWDALDIARAIDLWDVDWDSRQVRWRKGRTKWKRNGKALNPFLVPDTAPPIKDYLLSRGIDPFAKPAPRPRKTFDPYVFHPTMSRRDQIITVHPDYRRVGVSPTA